MNPEIDLASKSFNGRPKIPCMGEWKDWLAILRCLYALTYRHRMDKFQDEGNASVGRFIHSLVTLAVDRFTLGEIFPRL